MTHKTVNLNVPTLTRVEGEGAMHVSVRDGVVDDVRLEIYEPPRFFEAFLRGRHYAEPVDITARICGICPVAYQMSACHAIESIVDVRPSGAIRDLRRLLYCGEWIESHVLHIAFLHAPDFLGVDSGIDIARLHPELMAEVLHVKKTGNRILDVVGGRPIHPVNVRLGGFYKAPGRDRLDALLPDLERARDGALSLLRWVSTFEFPSVPGRLGDETAYVSLRHGREYPMNEGRVVSDRGLDVDVATYGERIRERHVAHSTALHATLDDGAGGSIRFQTGPLARWMNNADVVPSAIRAVADEVGVAEVETNPFRSILVRALETLYAIDEAIRIIRSYRPPSSPCVDVPPPVGVGHGCTEAPRGVLYHRYEIGADGLIDDAVIVPPTSQNQDAIEADLRDFVASHLHLDDHALGHRCEQVIRNYDPCISCATHFLRFEIDRSDDGANRAMSAAPTLLIGVGNRDRGDDAVGPVVCDRVATLSPAMPRTAVLESSVLDLSTYWGADDRVVVVDAAQPAGRPGRVSEFDAADGRFVVPRTCSTHSIDVLGAVELARAIGRLPAELRIVAVEALSFDHGAALTDPVERAASELVSRLVARSGEAVDATPPASGPA